MTAARPLAGHNATFGITRRHPQATKVPDSGTVLRFDAEGLVIEPWDAWNPLPDRRRLPSWSPFQARDS